jgi:hypothetical protein
VAKDLYKYDDPVDERKTLTFAMIKNSEKAELTGEIVGCVIAFLWVALVGGAVGACIWFLHDPVNPPVSPFVITVPLMGVVAYVACFFFYQMIQTVKAAKYALGHEYHVSLDTLNKICEGEYDRRPHFALENLGRRSRSRENTVTAYYFEKNGRASTTNLYLRASDFPGDTFYLVIRNRDGAVMTAYNTKKYRLETENGTT